MRPLHLLNVLWRFMCTTRCALPTTGAESATPSQHNTCTSIKPLRIKSWPLPLMNSSIVRTSYHMQQLDKAW